MLKLVPGVRVISFAVLLLSFWSPSESYIYGPGSLMIENLKFTKPCPEEGHNYHEETGNFLCVIRTAPECFTACQDYGCSEWFFLNIVSAHNTTKWSSVRCRCIPRLGLCMYNPVPPEFRDFR